MNKSLYTSYVLMVSLVIALPGSYLMGHRQGVREGITQGKIAQIKIDAEWVESGWRAAKAAVADCLTTMSQNGDVNVTGSTGNVSVSNQSNKTCIDTTDKDGKRVTMTVPCSSY